MKREVVLTKISGWTDGVHREDLFSINKWSNPYNDNEGYSCIGYLKEVRVDPSDSDSFARVHSDVPCSRIELYLYLPLLVDDDLQFLHDDVEVESVTELSFFKHFSEHTLPGIGFGKDYCLLFGVLPPEQFLSLIVTRVNEYIEKLMDKILAL